MPPEPDPFLGGVESGGYREIRPFTPRWISRSGSDRESKLHIGRLVLAVLGQLL